MRILVIEDEPDLLAALAQSLRENGYAVDEAADGRTGLYKAVGEYDAIVLDLMLPGMSGWDLLRESAKPARPRCSSSPRATACPIASKGLMAAPTTT